MKPAHGASRPGDPRRGERRAPVPYTCARCGERCCADDDGWVEMFGCLCLMCLKELETAPAARAAAQPPPDSPEARGASGTDTAAELEGARAEPPKRRRA